MDTELQATLKTLIDTIEEELVALSTMLDQEKANVRCLDWSDAGTLGYVVTQLESMRQFWWRKANAKDER